MRQTKKCLTCGDGVMRRIAIPVKYCFTCKRTEEQGHVKDCKGDGEDAQKWECMSCKAVEYTRQEIK